MNKLSAKASHYFRRRKMVLKNRFHDVARWTCPPLYKQLMKNEAVKHFQQIPQDESVKEFRHQIRLSLVEKYLSEAGYDTKTDTPYTEVLGLKNGLEEFQSMQIPAAKGAPQPPAPK